MKFITTTNVLLAVLVALVAYSVFFAGHAFGAAPAGSTFNDAKLASVNIAPAAITASSTSILNSDANPRIIVDNQFACVGSNGIGESVVAATTSVANLGLQGNTNYIMANNYATTTTTSIVETTVASTSEGALTGGSRVWPSGAYLTFVVGTTSNANFVNNSATCTVAVHYLAT